MATRVRAATCALAYAASDVFARTARVAAVVLLLLFASAYAVHPPMRTSGPAMTDFSAYYAAGVEWMRGGDPYASSLWAVERGLPGADPQGGLNPYVGPPLGLPLWAALAHLPYAVAVGLWGVVLIASIVVIVLVPARVAGRALDRGDALALALYGCACAPLIVGLAALGQASLPAVACVALAIAAVARTNAGWTAVAAACAATMKPNLAMPLVAALVSRRIAGALAGAAVVWCALNIAVAGGVRNAFGYLVMLPQQTASERFYEYQFTPTAVLHGWGLTPAGAAGVGTAISVLAIAAVVVAVVAMRARPADGVLLACAAVPLVVPYVHDVDMAIVLLPAFVALYRARGGMQSLASIALVALAANTFGLARGPVGFALTLVGTTIAALAIVSLARVPRVTLRFAPFAVVALVCVLGAAAPKSRMPAWPADLPPGFMHGLNAPASVIWQHEIGAIGLHAVDPWVALLRSIKLCGCVLAGVAFASTLRERRVAPRVASVAHDAVVRPLRHVVEVVSADVFGPHVDVAEVRDDARA